MNSEVLLYGVELYDQGRLTGGIKDDEQVSALNSFMGGRR